MTFTSPGPIVFEWGPISVRWYGLLIASAVVIGTFLAQRVAQVRYSGHWLREWQVIVKIDNFYLCRAYWLSLMNQRGRFWQILPDRVGDLVFWLILGAIPGARAYYVAFSWQRYQNVFTNISIGGVDLSIPSAFAIWEGGIAIHGAIIGGSIALGLFARKHKFNAWQLADSIAPALILGQGIGRWGNFFNSEAFGDPTNLPWKLYIPPDHRPAQYMMESYFHPTFLYESLWNLGVFGLLIMILGKFPRSKDGTLVAVYLIAYSLGRLWIEGLRTDSLMLGSLRIAQLISLAGISMGAIGLFRLYGKRT